MRSLILLALCASFAYAGTKVVYVMVENRSFDTMFGSMKGVNGLLGKTFANRVNNSDPASRSVPFSFDLTYINTCDPNHNVGVTTDKIFGLRHAAASNLTDPSMIGFIETEAMLHGASAAQLKYCQVMSGFAQGMLPVSNFLATEFALFDDYYASVPGPTIPNRFFALTGTAAGLTNTGPFFKNVPGLLFPQQTIFEQLSAAGKSVGFYYQGTPWELALRGVLHNPEMLHPWEEFLQSAQDGTLPDFSFINPRAGIEPDTGLGCNDYHPQHDAALGEAFLKQIYEAVRNGPDWTDTVLFINYDEHGGFSDHVSPPMKDIPPPNSPFDGPSYPEKFAFDRLGLRVPLIVVSPLIPRGTLVSSPPLAHYEHCSILGTARVLLNVSGSLTDRDAWTATFEHIFSLSEPRETPTETPAAPAPSMHPADEMQLEINDLQIDLLDMHNRIASHLHADHVPHKPQRQKHVHAAMANAFASIKKSIRASDESYALAVGPLPKRGDPVTVEYQFDINHETHLISTRSLNVSGTPFCLTVLPDDNITVALCRTVRSLSAPKQSFFYVSDSTIRIGSPDGHKCVTVTDAPDGDSIGARFLVSAYCDRAQSLQRFGYWGPAPGNEDAGFITWGNLVTVFLVNKM